MSLAPRPLELVCVGQRRKPARDPVVVDVVCGVAEGLGDSVCSVSVPPRPHLLQPRPRSSTHQTSVFAGEKMDGKRRAVVPEQQLFIFWVEILLPHCNQSIPFVPSPSLPRSPD